MARLTSTAFGWSFPESGDLSITPGVPGGGTTSLSSFGRTLVAWIAPFFFFSRRVSSGISKMVIFFGWSFPESGDLSITPGVPGGGVTLEGVVEDVSVLLAALDEDVSVLLSSRRVSSGISKMAGLTILRMGEFDDLGDLSTSPGLPGGGVTLEGDVSVLCWR